MRAGTQWPHPGEQGSRSNVRPSAPKISRGVYQSSLCPMLGSCSATVVGPGWWSARGGWGRGDGWSGRRHGAADQPKRGDATSSHQNTAAILPEQRDGAPDGGAGVQADEDCAGDSHRSLLRSGLRNVLTDAREVRRRVRITKRLA